MIKSGFLSLLERQDLESVVRCPSEDHGIARRCNALLLLDDGKSCQQIAQYLYLDDDTIRTWYKKYAEGGFDLMASFDYKGGFSKLAACEEELLVSWLDARVCRNVHEVRAYTMRKTWGYHQRVQNKQPIPLLMVAFGHTSQAQTLEYPCIQDNEIRDLYDLEL